MGFGFLALVIGYLPVLYQGFSHREVNISLLDARAGSPPTASELLVRQARNMAGLEILLRDWERWAAELMESHLSYPVLLFFRSQHEHQSWLGAMTAILDASALCIAGVQGGPGRQAQLTFAMARHAVVDLSQATGVHPQPRIPTGAARGLPLALPPGSERGDLKGPRWRRARWPHCAPSTSPTSPRWPPVCASRYRRGGLARMTTTIGAPARGTAGYLELQVSRGTTWTTTRTSSPHCA